MKFALCVYICIGALVSFCIFYELYLSLYELHLDKFKVALITGCERYNVLFAVGGIAQRLRWDHYIDLGGLDNDLGGIDNGLACQKW